MNPVELYLLICTFVAAVLLFNYFLFFITLSLIIKFIFNVILIVSFAYFCITYKLIRKLDKKKKKLISSV